MNAFQSPLRSIIHCVGNIRIICKVMTGSAFTNAFKDLFVRACHAIGFGRLLLIACLAIQPQMATAQTSDNPSGQKLPRFVTTKSEPINVRVGPGTRYDIAWTYVISGQPIEIIQEFDTWRKVRDADGDEGWIHQSLLSNRRGGYIVPLMAGVQTALRAEKSEQSATRALMDPGLRVTIENCDGEWCAIKIPAAPKQGRDRSYGGFVLQTELWGVYPGEQFD